MSQTSDEPATSERRRAVHWLAMAQGVFYLATGVWPLIDIESFQMVTGPKVDLWLVRTVGVLIAVIGGGLTLAGWRRRVALEVRLIAAGAALSLAAIDIIYVSIGRIAPIYLADAVVELLLVAAWIVLWKQARMSG